MHINELNNLLFYIKNKADIADKFMDSINVITSQERTDPNDESKKVKMYLFHSNIF